MALSQRDAAELVADRKPAYLQLKAGEQGSHFLLIEVRQPLVLQLCCWLVGRLSSCHGGRLEARA